MLADMAINSFAKALLTSSLPNQFQLMMAHASDSSPYFPPPAKFRDAVVNQLNRNSMLWVYVGHGNVQQLDSIQHNKQLYPILRNEDLKDLDSGKASSLAMLLACYSGAIDAPAPCLAEQMLRHSNGPVAAIAASRVSMPYGMSVIAKEMLHETFELHTPTIGEILRNAKREVALFEQSQKNATHDELDKLMASMAGSLSPAIIV